MQEMIKKDRVIFERPRMESMVVSWECTKKPGPTETSKPMIKTRIMTRIIESRLISLKITMHT